MKISHIKNLATFGVCFRRHSTRLFVTAINREKAFVINTCAMLNICFGFNFFYPK